MSYSQDRAERILTNFSHLIPELYSLYWETKEYIDPKDPTAKKIKKFAHNVKDLAQKYNLPNAYAVHFLLSNTKGPELGTCGFCKKSFYAKNRTEYQANWVIKQSLPCGHDKWCKCGKNAISQYSHHCEDCYKAWQQQNSIKIAEMEAKEAAKQKQEQEEQEEIPDFQGCYVCSWRIENRRVTSNYFWIKLSEIKQITDRNDCCSFNTYKDCEYYVYMSRANLIKAINLFLFKPEAFAEIYVTK